MKNNKSSRKLFVGKVFVDNVTNQNAKIKPQYKVKKLGTLKGKNTGISFGVKL